MKMKLAESLAPDEEKSVLELCKWWFGNEGNWRQRKMETGLSFLFKLHGRVFHYYCSYKIARIWGGIPSFPFSLITNLVLKSLSTPSKTRTTHKHSRFTSVQWGGLQIWGLDNPLQFTCSSLSCCRRLCFDCKGLSIYRIEGPRRRGLERWGESRERGIGKVVEDVAPGHNRFYKFNVGEREGGIASDVMFMASYCCRDHMTIYLDI